MVPPASRPERSRSPGSWRGSIWRRPPVLWSSPCAPRCSETDVRIPTHIMVHHSLTKDGATVSWGAIERYHREVMGWRDCGYHAGVELTGAPSLGPYGYQGLIGRPLAAMAAACPQGNMNNVALHVCCVGNYDLVVPPLRLLEVLIARVLLPWMREYGIPPENVVGHRDYNPAKTCPGSRFDLGRLRRMVR